MAPDARARSQSHCANLNGKYCKSADYPGQGTRSQKLRYYSAGPGVRLCLVLAGQTAGDHSTRFTPAIVGSRTFIRSRSPFAMGTRYCFHLWSAGISDVGLLLGEFFLANCHL